MNYYREALNLLHDAATNLSYDGDVEEQESRFDDLIETAYIATELESEGVSPDYAFYQAARRVVGFNETLH